MTKAQDYLKDQLTLRDKERERVLVRVPPWGKKITKQQLVNKQKQIIMEITIQRSIQFNQRILKLLNINLKQVMLIYIKTKSS